MKWFIAFRKIRKIGMLFTCCCNGNAICGNEVMLCSAEIDLRLNGLLNVIRGHGFK